MPGFGIILFSQYTVYMKYLILTKLIKDCYNIGTSLLRILCIHAKYLLGLYWSINEKISTKLSRTRNLQAWYERVTYVVYDGYIYFILVLTYGELFCIVLRVFTLSSIVSYGNIVYMVY